MAVTSSGKAPASVIKTLGFTYMNRVLKTTPNLLLGTTDHWPFAAATGHGLKSKNSALSRPNSCGILPVKWFKERSRLRSKERLPIDVESIPCNDEWESCMAITLLVSCLQEIPFHRHTLSEFAADQWERDPSGSDVMSCLKLKSASTSVFSRSASWSR